MGGSCVNISRASPITPDEAERNRLLTLEKNHDPHTFRLLEGLGVGEGWRCLEIGAGAGSVARWLAERVGPTGKVLATDINPRFLSGLAFPNLEVREHDIRTDPLEVAHYDLVHSRTVVMHLAEPEKALKRMADALRPGGWLLVEDFDFGSIMSADIVHPAAAPMIQFNRKAFDLLRKKGMMDCYFGRRERSLLEQLGFANVDHDGQARINRGGGPHAQFAIMTTYAAAKLLIAAGVVTQAQVDDIVRLYNDPSFYWPEYTLFSAWGQKPLG